MVVCWRGIVCMNVDGLARRISVLICLKKFNCMNWSANVFDLW